MPTDQPDGNITGFEGFQDIQRACCKSYASQPSGPQGAGGHGRLAPLSCARFGGNLGCVTIPLWGHMLQIGT